MERRIGGNFAGVRVFRGAFAESITRQHKADAVTVGATGMILVREGPRSDPKTTLGKALLAHELTHVKQAQKGFHFALEASGKSNEAGEAEAEKEERRVYLEANPADVEAKGSEVEHKIVGRVLELIGEEVRLRGQRRPTDT